jgi:hypothetical protein
MKRTFLPRSHQVYKMNMRGLPADVLAPSWENLLKPAIQKEAFNPATVPPGEFREIKRKNPANGAVLHDFIGQDCFVKLMGRPGRHVVSFQTSNGRYNVAKQRYESCPPPHEPNCIGVRGRPLFASIFQRALPGPGLASSCPWTGAASVRTRILLGYRLSMISSPTFRVR